MSESLGNFLLEEREENKDEMETGLKTKYIGKWGEIFAYNYLENLFRINGIRNYKIIPHENDQDDYDLEIYINNRSYKIEVKFSTRENYPNFEEIHFNNDFKYLLLVWKSPNNEIYFAILNRKEAKHIAVPMNAEREYEDDWQIQTISIFDKNNENFLKKLAMLLELNEELEDLEDEEKLYLIEKAKELVIKEHKDAQINDFRGEVYQNWIYNYLSNYVDDIELMPRGYKFDIKYKGKGIEIKYSSMYDDGEFQFAQIKPNNFEYILFIGFDNEENKFYFEIKSREEFENWLKEHDNNFQQNGNKIHVPKSFFTYVNDFTFEDFDNYIESH